MKIFAHLSPALLATALLTASGVWAQILTGKGFTADPNGYRSDEPLPSTQEKVALGIIIKDCPECPEMVVLPSGSFLVGSAPDPEPDPFSNEKPKAIGHPSEKPQHRVQIQSFAIGKYEVTQEQWFAVMGNNPSGNKGRTLPVEQVSWDDIQQFIAKLNQKTGQKYRLPSEAEWEYAARAGTTTEWSHGNDGSKLGHHAWYGKNSEGKTQSVGQKLPNAFGLYDVYGNVWEWTQDCWHETYVGAPADGSAWVTGCSGTQRVLRGGSWLGFPAYLRSANRGRDFPGSRENLNGFRLARTLFTP
jgi:formylglycine-generating enzyme required for sulfatase activity